VTATGSHARSSAAATSGSNRPAWPQAIVAQVERRITRLQRLGHVGVLRHGVCAKGLERDLLTRGELVENILESGRWSQVEIDRLSAFRLHDQVHAFERAPRGPLQGLVLMSLMVPDMVSIGGFTACWATPVGSPVPF
jgi:hypothetical protein